MLDLKDNQVHQALLVHRVKQEILVCQVLLALWDQQVPEVMLEHLELLVHQVQEVIRDPKDLPDSQVHLEILVILDLQEVQG